MPAAPSLECLVRLDSAPHLATKLEIAVHLGFVATLTAQLGAPPKLKTVDIGRCCPNFYEEPAHRADHLNPKMPVATRHESWRGTTPTLRLPHCLLSLGKNICFVACHHSIIITHVRPLARSLRFFLRAYRETANTG